MPPESAIHWLKHKALAPSAETGTPTLPPLDRGAGRRSDERSLELPPVKKRSKQPARNKDPPATFTAIAEHGPFRCLVA